MDQTIRLLQTTARDIYKIHFNKPDAYYFRRRKLTMCGEKTRRAKPLLEFIRRRHLEIGALLCVARMREP